MHVDLLGTSFVAWRDTASVPVLMPLHCPHMGAAQSGGTVVDGTLRCPFHHWQLGPDGRCRELPGGRRAPAAVHLPVLPTTERDGYMWFWHGTVDPLYPLPGPAISQPGSSPTYRVFHREDATGTPVRRVLENSFDPDHLVALHGLDVPGSTEADLFDPERADAEFGAVDSADSRLCAIFSWPS